MTTFSNGPQHRSEQTHMLDASETIRLCETAVAEARDFFGIDPLHRINIRAHSPTGGAAGIDSADGYLSNNIYIDLDYYQKNPHRIRRDMAHEVAHLVSNEIGQLRRRMPPEWRDNKQAAGGLLSDAIETLTVRLELLFLRERPDEP